MSATSLVLDASAGAVFLAAMTAAAAAVRRLCDTRNAEFRLFAEPGVYWEHDGTYIHKSVLADRGATLLGIVMLVEDCGQDRGRGRRHERTRPAGTL